MRLSTSSASLALAAILLSHGAFAQPPGGRGRGGPPEGPDGRGRPPIHPLAEAIDTDGNNEISAAELERATESLKKLDRDGDGKLTSEEIHREGGRGGPGRGGPGRGGPDRNRGPGNAPGGDASSSFVARMLNFDDNGDGKLSGDEIPGRMRNAMGRFDKNKDDALDKSELETIATANAGDNRGDSGRRGAGRPEAPRGDGGRGLGGPEGRGGGTPGPEEFVKRAMAFDADGDGKLNRQELGKLAEEFARRGGEGPGPRGDGRGFWNRGRGGPDGGGRGFGGRSRGSDERKGGDRRQRPN